VSERGAAWFCWPWRHACRRWSTCCGGGSWPSSPSTRYMPCTSMLES